MYVCIYHAKEVQANVFSSAFSIWHLSVHFSACFMHFVTVLSLSLQYRWRWFAVDFQIFSNIQELNYTSDCRD